MVLHISEKNLKKMKFSIKKMEEKIQLQGYLSNISSKRLCKNCVLKRFTEGEVVNIEVVDEIECLCSKENLPIMTFEVSSKKNRTITIL